MRQMDRFKQFGEPVLYVVWLIGYDCTASDVRDQSQSNLRGFWGVSEVLYGQSVCRRIKNVEILFVPMGAGLISEDQVFGLLCSNHVTPTSIGQLSIHRLEASKSRIT
ncbi:hypothetical protein SAMN04488092_110121 [Thalassovita taeanensis]|uniref:Uncharacterized protein n=1 Tax=Thalassovita taeanensis TaxID=657014 RepID=A0A1H9HWN8_9RHOB|nr:hypothetical protein SAMN04488092_110121 [Thalassovita taeanensis]